MLRCKPLQPSARDQDAKVGDGGFTLLELLVTFVIVAALAAIAITVFINQRAKGIDVGIRADLNSAAKTAESITADDPDRAAALTASDFSAEGFAATTGNVIEVAGSPAEGYCLRGVNPDSSATASSTDAFWFDSRAGGLTSQPGPRPAGGACASAGPTDWVTIG